jgi:hypothetical protein
MVILPGGWGQRHAAYGKQSPANSDYGTVNGALLATGLVSLCGEGATPAFLEGFPKSIETGQVD